MRYVVARLKQETRDTAYRIYVTDALQGIPQNKFSKQRYWDIIKDKGNTDTRTGDEIAADIIKRLGLKVV